MLFTRFVPRSRKSEPGKGSVSDRVYFFCVSIYGFLNSSRTQKVIPPSENFVSNSPEWKLAGTGEAGGEAGARQGRGRGRGRTWHAANEVVSLSVSVSSGLSFFFFNFFVISSESLCGKLSSASILRHFVSTYLCMYVYIYVSKNICVYACMYVSPWTFSYTKQTSPKWSLSFVP